MKKLLLSKIPLLFFLAGLLITGANAASQGGENVRLYGYRNFQGEKPSGYVCGPISFESNDPSSVTLLNDQTKLGRIYAGEYVNYKWYALTTKAGFQSTPEDLITIDMKTGVRTKIAPASKQLYDMAYDYTTETMFGILDQGESLGKVDLKTGEVSRIAYLPSSIYSDNAYAMALACDKNGQLYMMGMNDTLYTIDKKTAAYKKIGYSGTSVAYTQSMGFDHNTGILYWVNAGDYKLYTVDIQTGAATLIGKVGLGDNISSLFVPYINVPKGAPDRVLNKKASSDKLGALKTTLSWTNPSTDVQNKPLTDVTGIKIYRDNEAIITLPFSTDDIGQEQAWVDESATAGKHIYNIVAENSKGEGGMDDALLVYVGGDIPGTVLDLKVVSGDNDATLSWKAPVSGGSDGFYDPTKLSGYKIIRSGSADTVTVGADQLSYIDKNVPKWGKYSYKIFPYNETGDGIISTTEEILIKPTSWIIMNEGTENVSEGTFFDTGGPDANYKNAERIVMTLTPTVGTKLHIKFKSFKTELDRDFLEVFDGNSVEAKSIGKFSGSAIPSVLKDLIASNATGSLTFSFSSDVMQHEPGWEAAVSCFEVKNNDVRILNLQGEKSPVVGSLGSYTVDVQNVGANAVEAGSYKVQLLGANDKILSEVAGVALSSMETKSVSLSFTPEGTAVGETALVGQVVYSADDDITNNKTEELAVEIYPRGTSLIEIGHSQTTIGMYPVSFMSDYSLGQSLYQSSSIPVKKGEIKQIAYPAKVDVPYADIPVKVWMYETELTDLSAGNILSSDMTLVFEGKSDFPAGSYDWTLKLDEPFAYTGKNLVVMISKNAVETSNFGVLFYYTSTGDVITTRCATGYDAPVDDNAQMGEYSGERGTPDIRILMMEDVSGVNQVENTELVYPNPFGDYIRIESQKGISGITMTDLAGKIVLQSNVVSDRIETAALPAGIYFMKISTVDGTSSVHKMIKK